jgi:hypothetical protein
VWFHSMPQLCAISSCDSMSRGTVSHKQPLLSMMYLPTRNFFFWRKNSDRVHSTDDCATVPLLHRVLGTLPTHRQSLGKCLAARPGCYVKRLCFLKEKETALLVRSRQMS